MYRTGGQTNVNFALSNSGELGSFRLSYNYRDYDAITLNADNKAHQFAFSADLKANDWVKGEMEYQLFEYPRPQCALCYAEFCYVWFPEKYGF